MVTHPAELFLMAALGSFMILVQSIRTFRCTLPQKRKMLLVLCAIVAFSHLMKYVAMFMSPTLVLQGQIEALAEPVTSISLVMLLTWLVFGNRRESERNPNERERRSDEGIKNAVNS